MADPSAYSDSDSDVDGEVLLSFAPTKRPRESEGAAPSPQRQPKRARTASPAPSTPHHEAPSSSTRGKGKGKGKGSSPPSASAKRTNSKKGSRKKQGKSVPEGRQKPKNAYHRFCDDITTKHADEVAKIKAASDGSIDFLRKRAQWMGKMWNKLSTEEKAPWTEAATRAMAEYQVWLQGTSDVSVKRPPNKFVMFCADWRQNNPAHGMSFSEQRETLTAAWGKMTEEEKQPYHQRAKEAMEKYQKRKLRAQQAIACAQQRPTIQKVKAATKKKQQEEAAKTAPSSKARRLGECVPQRVAQKAAEASRTQGTAPPAASSRPTAKTSAVTKVSGTVKAKSKHSAKAKPKTTAKARPKSKPKAKAKAKPKVRMDVSATTEFGVTHNLVVLDECTPWVAP